MCFRRIPVHIKIDVYKRQAFRPHITLARRVVMNGAFNISDFNRQLPQIGQQVYGISLMKSEQSHGKVCYTELYFRKCD